MKLSDILPFIPDIMAILTSEAHDPNITGIQYRSTDVRPGNLFVAIPGFKTDGHKYIEDACRNGAAVVVAQKQVPCSAILVLVKDPRKALAYISSRFYNHPSEKLFMIGITGTNGKTTTSYLIEQILIQTGLNAGVIGTVNYRYNGKIFPNPMTTPESLDLQRILFEMLQNGITHGVMETTSHAIDLHRVACCWYDIGVFTNLTQDHLDYHQDMESYWRCKQKLFTEYLTNGPKKGKTTAVINCRDPRGLALIHMLNLPMVAVNPPSDLKAIPNCSKVQAIDPIITETGISATIQTPLGSFKFRSSLTGLFNLDNILCAVGTAIAMNLSLDDIKNGIESLSSVPGRLEYIPNDHQIHVYVDFAHSPDALENVLRTLQQLAKKRIITVFGCGGDRDKSKRPKMGEIVGRLSDFVVVTSDNPRTEDPIEIIRQIIPGVVRTCTREYLPTDLNNGFNDKGYVVIPDRRAAIQMAIQVSTPEDIVLIAGKGHETYQLIGNQTIPFDDRLEAKEALNRYGTTI